MKQVCVFTRMSWVSLHELDPSLQKVGLGTVALALYPFESPDVLEDSNQTGLRFILR